MSVTGIDRATAGSVAGIDHLRQSVHDILTTPIGARVMRRDYGSALPDLIDQPLTGLTLARIYAATAEAIARWEPRVRLRRVRAQALPGALEDGRITITLEGDYLPESRAITLDGIVFDGGMP